MDLMFLRTNLFYESVRILQKELSIIAGPSSPDLAAKIAQDLRAELIPVDVRIFSDGESRIKMGNVKKKNCVIVQSTYPPTDRHLLQTLMMIKKCTDDLAADICTVIPYMAYARQDRAFQDGEVISIELIAKLLEAAGNKRLITIDIHSPLALSYFRIDVQNISSIPLLANYAASNMKLNRTIVVSPDAGGIKRAYEFAKILGSDIIALKKCRDSNSGEVFIDDNLEHNIADRDVIIVDDIITSGGTIAKACRVLKKNKADKIYTMCVHAPLVEDAAEKIRAAGVKEIISTNSIPSPYAKVDISPIVSSSVRSLPYTQ
jgi:ribose-phosphate pyrophosphokinase